jgi:hypothetical protein
MAPHRPGRNAVVSLLDHLTPRDRPPDPEIHITTKLIVRQTTDLPKDALQDLKRPRRKRSRRLGQKEGRRPEAEYETRGAAQRYHDIQSK